jgi:predicted phosphodiesterase
MKLWILSDLHLEIDSGLRKGTYGHLPEADVCLIAGDILTGGPENSIEWLGAMIAPRMPVTFVAGIMNSTVQKRATTLPSSAPASCMFPVYISLKTARWTSAARVF